MSTADTGLTPQQLADMMDPGAGIKIDAYKVVGYNDAQSTTPAPEVVAPNTSAPQDYVDTKGKVSWVDTPTFENQYKRYPETCRLVGPQLSVFNITEAEEMMQLNSMLLKQQPEEAPSILIASKKENFHEGKWLVLLEYYRVEYKQLIQTS